MRYPDFKTLVPSPVPGLSVNYIDNSAGGQTTSLVIPDQDLLVAVRLLGDEAMRRVVHADEAQLFIDRYTQTSGNLLPIADYNFYKDQAEQIDMLTQRMALLTPREIQVLRYVVAGNLNKQIAAELGTVEKTIKVISII